MLGLYPNSRRAPTALYKSGLLELRRGNTDDARTFFNRVVQGYPDSDEFELVGGGSFTLEIAPTEGSGEFSAKKSE